MKKFLDRDQGLEAVKNLYSDKVIIDKKDWESAISLLNPSLMTSEQLKMKEHPLNDKPLPDNTYKISEGYNPPPVEKLDPKLRPGCGIKHDSDKPRFDLIPIDALEEVAKVYTVGAKKYGDRNWEKGLSYGRLFGALLRHVYAWWRGERDDKENKLHHLSSVIFCALGLLHYELNSEKFKKFDNRNLEE